MVGDAWPQRWHVFILRQNEMKYNPVATAAAAAATESSNERRTAATATERRWKRSARQGRFRGKGKVENCFMQIRPPHVHHDDDAIHPANYSACRLGCGLPLNTPWHRWSHGAVVTQHPTVGEADHKTPAA